MRRVKYLALAVVLLVFSSIAHAAVPVDVAVGKGTVITLKKVSERVSISNPAIAELILISPNEILLNGLKAGVTSMIVWDKEGKRTFFDVNVFGDIEALREKIEALAPSDNVEIEMAGDALLITGTVRSENTAEKIVELSKAYSPKVLNFITLPNPEQVMLEVKIASLDRTKMDELGVSFMVKNVGGGAEFIFPGLVASPSGTLGGPAPSKNVTPGLTGFNLDSNTPQVGVTFFPAGVSVFLRALAAKGYAKVLAEPNLVVRSGEKGEFLAGRKVPVQQVTGVGAGQTVSIVFEEVGIRLNFEPKVLDDGTIRLKIDPAEVSTIIQFIAVQNLLAPEIGSRSVSTSVDLKSGESLVLAGMLSEEMKNNISKVPLLGDIPILGALFRSSKKELMKTELVFIITPSLVKPMPLGTVPPTLPGEGFPADEDKNDYDWIPLPRSSDAGAVVDGQKNEMAKSGTR